MPRTPRIGVWALLALAVAGVLAGCGGDDGPSGGDLSGRWVLTSYLAGDALQDVPGTVAADATFDGARVSGRAGVNTFAGGYTSTPDGALDIGDLATTQMAGPEEAMRVEAAYLSALRAADGFSVDGETLTLSRGGDDVLVYARDARGVTGEWEVTGYNNGRDAVVSVVAGSRITADFADDGALTGSAGVNRYTTRYTTTEDAPGVTGIRVEPPATTRKAGPEDLMRQEQEYLAALESARTVTLQGDAATLRDADDSIAVTMTRR